MFNSSLDRLARGAYVTYSMAKPRLALTILDPDVIEIIKAKQATFRRENGVSISLAQIAIMMITQHAKQNHNGITKVTLPNADPK